MARKLKMMALSVVSATVVTMRFVTFAATTESYIKDGLIAMWDGYENNGAGGHITTLAEWKDTSGKYAFAFNSNSGITVGENGAIVFPGTQMGYATLNQANTEATFGAAANGTCEIVLVETGRSTALSAALHSTAQTGIAFAASKHDAGGTPKLLTYSSGTGSDGPAFFCDWSEGIATYSMLYSSKRATNVWMNAERQEISGSGTLTSKTTATVLGNRQLTTGVASAAFEGMIYAIRLYSRPLTKDEIVANHAIDVKRFEEGDFSEGGKLFVTGKPCDFGEVVPAYGVVSGLRVGDEVPCSAPAVWTNRSETVKMTCVGYKVYTNGVVYVQGNRTSFTYTHPDCGSDGAKLVWQWMPRTYVERDLIVRWDGYENDGKGGHAKALTEWKDTSGKYAFAFNLNSGITVGENGAIVFPGKSAGCATLGLTDTEATFVAAANGTCEIVLQSDEKTGANVALQSSPESGIAFGARKHDLGAIPELYTYSAASGNDGSTFFCDWSEGIATYAMLYSDRRATNICVNAEQQGFSANTVTLTSNHSQTTLGNRHSGAAPFAGKIYAIRLYSRPLTEEEIAVNHALDVKRFVEGSVSKRGLLLIFR